MAESSSYTPIQTYRSTTAGNVPSVNDLAEGELAVNLADQLIYSKLGNDIIVIGFGGDFTIGGDDWESWLEEYVDNRISQYFRPGVQTEAGTSRTIAATDETDLIVFTSDSAISVTIPTDDTVIPIGFIVHLHQAGAGAITVAGATGAVTVTSSRSLVTGGTGAAFSLFKIGINNWVVVGDQE